MRLDLPANSKPKKTKKNGGMKTDLHEDNGQVVDVTTKTVLDPWNPYFPLWPPEIPPNLGLNGAIGFIENLPLHITDAQQGGSSVASKATTDVSYLLAVKKKVLGKISYIIIPGNLKFMLSNLSQEPDTIRWKASSDGNFSGMAIDACLDNIDFPLPGQIDCNITDWWIEARRCFRTGYRKIFDSVFMLNCWLIWKERNARIFDQKMCSPDQLVEDIKEEIMVWKTAAVA
uniref:Uncharacterized protein n=1 Tax=Oryza meridionalis TaxID=40149 RepID=A0A0E0DLD5_9ORYZ